MSKINLGLLGIFLIIIINIFSINLINNKVNSIIDKASEITLLLEDIDQDIHEQNN